MRSIGRWAAAGALVSAVVLGATWDAGPSGGDAGAAPTGGAALYRAKGCAACHDGPATSAPLGNTFPSLANASDWAGARRPGVSAEDYLVESIAAPDVFISPAFGRAAGPVASMPRLALTPEEIDAIVDHLLAGRPG